MYNKYITWQTERSYFFNENLYGEEIVTTARPIQYQPNKVSYVDERKMSYEDYMFSETQNQLKRKNKGVKNSNV